MVSDERRARAAQRRALREARGGEAGRGAELRQDQVEGYGFYDRGDTYGGGRVYAPPGKGVYGKSEYGSGATYGEAERTPTVGRYGMSWYGRGHIYGS